MTHSIGWLARGVATVGILGCLSPGAPAATAAQEFAQAAPAASPGQAAAPAPASAPTGLADARIADLRKKLHITTAQEPTFTALADVIRANAQSMEALLADREKDTEHSAVDSLRWYERLTDAHAAALKQFVPAFDALYATLSDSQRTAADTMFERFAQRPIPRKSK